MESEHEEELECYKRTYIQHMYKSSKILKIGYEEKLDYKMNYIKNKNDLENIIKKVDLVAYETSYLDGHSLAYITRNGMFSARFSYLYVVPKPGTAWSIIPYCGGAHYSTVIHSLDGIRELDNIKISKNGMSQEIDKGEFKKFILFRLEDMSRKKLIENMEGYKDDGRG